MPATRCSKAQLATTLAAALLSAATPADAVESELAHAVSVPHPSAADAADVALPDAFWLENLTTFLRGRVAESARFDPASLLSGLTTLGVSPAQLSAAPTENAKTNPNSASRPVLKLNVCMNSHPLTDERKALLVTVPLAAASARRAALLFSWLKSTPPATPVVLCASAADAPGASHRAVEEILTRARERRLDSGFNGFAGFWGHVDWSGNPSRAYVNFAGLQAVTLSVADRYIQWQDTQTRKTNAFMAVAAVKTALLALPLTFKTDRMSPYTATEFSTVRCRGDWASLLTSECSVTAVYSSRSKVALTEAGEATYGAAQKTIKRLNDEDKKGARRSLTVSFPENYSFSPAAQQGDLPLVTAWEKRFAGLSNARLSSRFAVTPAVVSAAAGLPALALGASGEASTELSAATQAVQEKAVLGLLNDVTSTQATVPERSASTRSQ